MRESGIPTGLIDREDIGTGEANTADYVAVLIEHPDNKGLAMEFVSSYNNNGQSDWYVPSKDELNELCKHARGQTTGDTTVACNATGTLRADFTNGWYWSSTLTYAFFNYLGWWQAFYTSSLDFPAGYTDVFNVNNGLTVRAIRAG